MCLKDLIRRRKWRGNTLSCKCYLLWTYWAWDCYDASVLLLVGVPCVKTFANIFWRRIHDLFGDKWSRGPGDSDHGDLETCLKTHRLFIEVHITEVWRRLLFFIQKF